ncbi:MAG: FecR domain-containing protein, partial [Magnetococcales bacterium]|nr:FecR domain-containing protein [Magnetococcales bacterium]
MAKHPIRPADFKPRSIKADESVLPNPTSMANEFLLSGSDDLLQGEFLRSGDDLVIVDALGEQHLIEGYFSQNPPPTLKTTSGDILLPENVEFLLTASPETVLVAGPKQNITTQGSTLKIDTDVAIDAFQESETISAIVVDSATPTTIGKVTKISGEVTATNKAGEVRVLKDGDEILTGETLETAKGGMLELSFTDGATFQLGESSSSLMDIQQNGSLESSFSVSLLSGTISYASGDSASDNFTIKTPSSVISIQDGSFQAEVGSDGRTTVVNNSGSMEVSDTAGNNSVTINEAGTATTINVGEAPQAVFTPSPEFIATLNQSFSLNTTVSSTTNESSIPQNVDQPQVEPPTTTLDTLLRLETNLNNTLQNSSVAITTPLQEQPQITTTPGAEPNTATLSSITNTNNTEASNSVVLLGKVTGIATDFATIDGTATTRLTTLTNQYPDLTIEITDATNIAQFNTIDALTNNNVELTGGLSDIATNLVATNGVVTTGLTAATTQNSAVAITISDTPTIAQINAISQATTGVVTASISGTTADLTSLTSSSSDLITITVTDTPTVSKLNTIAEASGGVVTASLSGNAAYLMGLTTSSTDAIAITVSDPIDISQFMVLNGITSIDITLAGGLSDTAAHFASFSGSVSSGLRAAAAQDPNVVITLSDAANIAQFNTIDALTLHDVELLGGLSDTAINYASTSGTATSGLKTATTQSPDVVITVTDATNIAQFTAIDALTTRNVVMLGGLSDTA